MRRDLKLFRSKISPALSPRLRRKRRQFAVDHLRFGLGQLASVRLGQSGVWLADVLFNGERRTLRLEQKFWTTPVANILAVAAQFPPLPRPKPVERKATVAEREEKEGQKHEPECDDEAAKNEEGDEQSDEKLELA